MAYTVPYSFTGFINNISLAGKHEDTANRRKDHVVRLLGNTFTIVDAIATGSVPKETALKSRADLDVMLVLHWDRHVKGKAPQELLQDVRDALGEYETYVRRNGQAVTLYYETWPDVDIVPVSRVLTNTGLVDYYSVPDANSGRWLRARPRKHAKIINDRDDECGGGFKPMVRMIKEWSNQHSDLIESFHIEVLCLSIFSHMSDCSWDVFTFFDKAIELCSAPLLYDGSHVDDYLDNATRAEVLKRLRTARGKASNAWYLTYADKSEHREAISIWREIFGDRFPAYG